MTLATNFDLDAKIGIPFGLCESRLDPGVSVPVAILKLTAGQSLSMNWLDLNLIRMVFGAVPTKRNPGLGAVYAGLIGGRADLIGGPPGQPLSYVGVDTPGSKRLSPWLGPVTITETDTYSVIVVNNLKDARLDVCVTGNLTVTQY